jgi:hypothetical protein
LIVEGPIIQLEQSTTVYQNTLVSGLGFLGYAYLPLIPLVLLGRGRVNNNSLRRWSLGCLLLAATSTSPFFITVVAGYRWVILLDVPVCIYAVAGLRRLRETTVGQRHLNFFRQRTSPILFTILVMSSALYVASPAQQAMPYYAMFPSYLPTSMLQNTVPLSEMASLRQALAWVSDEMVPNEVLITHSAIYGWARIYFDYPDRILTYGFSSPLVGLKSAISAGYKTVFLIWWNNGTEWYHEPIVPSPFTQIHAEGKISVYVYSLADR